MLEITRGRTWEQFHTVTDSEGGPYSDLTGLTFRSQIREKVATRNANGIFEHRLVATVDVTSSGVTGSTLRQFLTRSATSKLELKDYLIDILATDEAGNDQSILDPEPIRVIARPTSVTAGDIIPEDVPSNIPNFSEQFEEALND